MTLQELLRGAASVLRAVAAWARSLSLFAIAIAFAISGHVVFVHLLGGFKFAGVDFAALDQSHNLVPVLQILLFAVETGLVVFALVRSGLDRTRTYIGVAALLWAAAMLMITFVSAQCSLYGVCL